MGADIHDYLEVRDAEGRWRRVEGVVPFEHARNYALFGWLADVRNYSAVTPLADPRGIPTDASGAIRQEWEDSGDHSATWFTLAELLAVDYDAEVNDRRVTRTLPSGVISGGETGEPDEGERMPLREFLGEWVVQRIATLAEGLDPAGARIVMWFDN